MKWKKLDKEKPKENKQYLCRVVDCDEGNFEWFEVLRWDNHTQYASKYSKEFKQDVRIQIKSSKCFFDAEVGCVVEWMEIPQ